MNYFKNMVKHILLGFTFQAVILSTAVADTIELNNGKTFEGTFTGRDGDNISFDVDGITMTFKASDVKNISMGGSAAPSAAENKETVAAESDKPAQKVTIPAGTALVIRMAEALNPERNAEGHKFTAKLESALVIDGQTVIPVDSNVYGVVLEATKSRRLAGQASIRLGVTDIRVNGVMHKVKTSELTGVGEQTARKSAGQVGKWTAVGALADGSSGAKTGAKVGLGAAVLTRGNQAEIPAGTLLEFSLLEPLSL